MAPEGGTQSDGPHGRAIQGALGRIAAGLDRLSRAAASVAMGLIVALITVMTVEVVMRRVFDAPTIWAFDLSYMASGAVFVLAAGHAYLRDAHVRVTFLSQRWSARSRALVEASFLALALVPILAILTHAAADRALSAYRSGEVERVSVWAPVVWPFLTALAVGLATLLLQCVAEILKRALALAEQADLGPAATAARNPAETPEAAPARAPRPAAHGGR